MADQAARKRECEGRALECPWCRAVGLRELAWSYIPSDVWADVVLTTDHEEAKRAREYGREVTALTDHAAATARIAELQAKLEAAERERDELRAKLATELERLAYLCSAAERDEYGWWLSDICVLAIPENDDEGPPLTVNDLRTAIDSKMKKSQS